MDRKPVRTCVACLQEDTKQKLVRIVRGAGDSGAVIDPTGRAAGRGAYIHPDASCIEIARKRKALERSLKATVGPEVWSQLSR